METPKIAVVGGQEWQGEDPVPAITKSIADGGGIVVDLADRPDALVWLDQRHPERLHAIIQENGDHLRWVQLPWAGVEHFAKLGMFDTDRVWTCAKGIYAEQVAESALALLLAVMHWFPKRARARSWGELGGNWLAGKRVTILGAGGIAKELIQLLQPFHCEITVVRRSASPVDGATRVIQTKDLHTVLPTTDVLALAASHTPETEGIIGEPELKLLPNTAFIVNVSRGKLIDTNALVTALKNGEIAGIGTDVTDPEPLPDGHPLWDMDNVLITPHNADDADWTTDQLAERVRENTRRFANGEPLEGIVDVSAGY